MPQSCITRENETISRVFQRVIPVLLIIELVLFDYPQLVIGQGKDILLQSLHLRVELTEIRFAVAVFLRPRQKLMNEIQLLVRGGVVQTFFLPKKISVANKPIGIKFLEG